ncbi:MAG: hypothetical protein HY557_01635 [Euryarchaeota archaeon]|nr:hypothetical protein [Euryarchaeota archaeon]
MARRPACGRPHGAGNGFRGTGGPPVALDKTIDDYAHARINGSVAREQAREEDALAKALRTQWKGIAPPCDAYRGLHRALATALADLQQATKNLIAYIDGGSPDSFALAHTYVGSTDADLQETLSRYEELSATAPNC